MRDMLFCLAFAVVTPFAAVADNQPVVVELFTSQGCSSCPPADRLMAQIADNPKILPLTLHVDYWDYIGWADSFADPRFTKRQKAYAHASGERMVYTPQVIVGGDHRIVGSRVMQVADAIMSETDLPQAVNLDVQRSSDMVSVRAELAAGAAAQPMIVQLVHFIPHERVAIHAGENAGKVVDYVNVVKDWKVIGEWDGSGVWTFETPVEGPAAIIVQAPGPGEILGAQRID